MAFQIPSVEALASPRDAPTPSHLFGTNEDSLVSALHAAFHNLGHHNNQAATHEQDSAPTPPSHHKERDRDKHMSLEISLTSDALHLKGTGVDVEPALMSGNVVLHLSEATSIREINLQFRGKARLSLNPSDPHVLNTAPSVYVVCNHEWSFLEGEKKHSHTLKPGRHLFPFQLRIGGSLPSTIMTYTNGGASVFYKLRATAIRPGFASNLTATCPVTILRSFAAEALEYQQTLEIENTWPEKLMYALMLPHKAWAAGDELSTLVKFAPLAKGVRVLSVTTYLNETVKTFGRSGYTESTRSVVQMKHNLVGNRAIPAADPRRLRFQALPPPSTNPSRIHSMPATPYAVSNRSPLGMNDTGYINEGYNASSAYGSNAASPDLATASSSQPDYQTLSLPHSQMAEEEEEEPSEVTAHIIVPIPKGLTPSHTLDPIIVSYRVRWIIIITNLDGHTSELRCSLPIHILDHMLMDEAVSATKATRRLLFGGPETNESDEDMELPSYPAHVRDRVANMYIPESATVRITNPWVLNQVDPVTGHMSSGIRTPASGIASPLYSHPLSSHFPLNPDDSTDTPLEWVNSELLMSLSEQAPPTPQEHGVTRSLPESSESSRSGSRRTSRRPSRANSRAASPERGTSASSGVPTITRADETHVHALNPGSRQNSGIFQMAMKPLTSLSHPWSHTTSRTHMTHGSGSMSSGSVDQRLQAVPIPTTVDPNSGAALLHRAFTEVPDYAVASRGFLGGGPPPLELQRGLPSYDEARRSAGSDSNLSGYFGRAAGVSDGSSTRSASSSSLAQRTA